MSAPGDRGADGPLGVVHGVDEDRVVVRADLDLSLAGALHELTLNLLGAGGDRPVAIDLSGAPFLDSSGVQALVKLAGAAGRRRLRVIARGQPYQVLELTEVLALLNVQKADG